MFLWGLVLGEWYYFFEKKMCVLKCYFHLFTACKQPLHFLKPTILFHLLINCIVYKINKVRTESLILEKVLKFAQQFSRHWKSLENRGKSW